MNKELTIKLYQSINDNDRPRDISHWHASSISKCPRSLYMERLGVKGLPENEAGGGKKLRWRSGHIIESVIRPELQNVYPNLITNVRFTNEELDLTGEFDAYDPDSKTLISVKSVHDFAFITRNGTTGIKEQVGTKTVRKWTEKRGFYEAEMPVYDLKKEPYLHYQWQEHAYVLLMNHSDTVLLDSVDWEDLAALPHALVQSFPKQWPVEQITYVVISLGGLMACYTTPVNEEILSRVQGKINYLNVCWKAKITPVCLCQEGQEMYQVQDQYCPYKTASGCCDESLIKVKEKV